MFGKWRRARQERLERNAKWYSSWQGMNAWAWWLLNNSQELDPRLYPLYTRPEVRLWDDGTGAWDDVEPTTWSVFDIKKSLVVREAVWQRRSDLEKTQRMVQESNQVVTFQPIVTVRDAPVPTDQLAMFLKEATTFHLPLVWLPGETDSVTDVGSFGFEFYTKGFPPVVVSLQWSVIPEELKPIEEWVRRLHEFLRTCLELSDLQSGAPEVPGDL